jgi:CBS domain containing-hemolysin-like protein
LGEIVTGVGLATITVMLLLSAGLTAARTAIFRIGESRLRTLLDEGFRGADALSLVRGDADRIQFGLRILGSALNLAIVGIATMASGLAWGSAAALGTLVGGIAVVLFVTDALPRTLAWRHPVRLALFSAPVLLLLSRWLRPVTTPLARIENVLSGGANGEVSDGEREFREIQEIGQVEGMVEDHENLLVERAFRLDELTAWDAMTPRVDVFAWREDLTLEEIAPELSEVPYSRIPVYGESVDDITGVLHVREAYQALVERRENLTLASLSREPFFVPRSLSLSQLLQDFQARRIHMGIVADEFGGIDGLVTLEDVLEELVGEIVDETDVDEEELLQVSPSEVLADAGVDLRDINRVFETSLSTAEHRSLNGYILEELGHVPDAGEVLVRGGVRIEVLEASETQVVRARLILLPDDDTARGKAPD